MSSQTVFIVNPAAGRGKGATVWRELEKRLNSTPVSYSVAFTTGPLDATVLTRKALQDGVRTVIAVGGDGTANEVVNAFFRDGHPVAPEARVAFVAAGTGNDVGRQFALADPVQLGETTMQADVLRLCFSGDGSGAERYALFHAGVGLATEVAEMSSRLKQRLGGLAYVAGTVVALYQHRPRRSKFCCDDGHPVSGDFNFIVAANGQYGGGGMKIAPMASIDDGVLDVITLRGASRRAMLLRLLPAVYRGAHMGHPAVGHHRTRTLLITADRPLSVQTDGELAGTTPVSIEVLSHALAVCV